MGLFVRSRENKGFYSPLIDHDSVFVDIWKWQLREYFPILEDRRQWILNLALTDPTASRAVNAALANKEEGDEPEISELRWILEPVFPAGRALMRWMNKARNKLAHRTPLDPAFLAKGEKLFGELQAKFPHVQFSADRAIGPAFKRLTGA